MLLFSCFAQSHRAMFSIQHFSISEPTNVVDFFGDTYTETILGFNIIVLVKKKAVSKAANNLFLSLSR